MMVAVAAADAMQTAAMTKVGSVVFIVNWIVEVPVFPFWSVA